MFSMTDERHSQYKSIVYAWIVLSAFLKNTTTRLYTMEGLDVSACYGQLAVSPPPVVFFWTIIYRLVRTYKRAAGAACDANCDERSQHFSKIGPIYVTNVVAPSIRRVFLRLHGHTTQSVSVADVPRPRLHLITGC